ncbi:hypothetical protein A0H81_02820 [Grifola frondosa]|uniref:Uncharacterized protein n=1 Tax=Grifola frondosa TaxID=5627 RepID=A0A1C7MK20_GRIFR|nr:hypothetical protein A0H81_02820 [Grifola frondosa]
MHPEPQQSLLCAGSATSSSSAAAASSSSIPAALSSGTYGLPLHHQAARLPAFFLPTNCISPPPVLLSSGTDYTDFWDESLAVQPDHNPEFDMFLRRPS